MSDYEVKWKGRQSGPYSLKELRSKFESREIGGMHEVCVDGQWMTVRAFFRRNPAPASPSAGPDASSNVVPEQKHAAPFAVSEAPSGSQPKAFGTQSIVDSTEMTLPITRREEGEPMHHYYAGFWIRAMALLIDGLILLWAPLWVYDYFQEGAILTLDTLRTLTGIQWALAGFVGSAAGWLYFTIFDASALQGSPGKHLVGLSVHRNTGSRVDIGTASLRNLAKVGSGLMLGTGFLLALFTPRRQTFHDLVSHTVVSLNLPATTAFHIRN